MNKISATLSTIALLSGLALSTPLVPAATANIATHNSSSLHQNSKLVAMKRGKKAKHHYHARTKKHKHLAKKK